MDIFNDYKDALEFFKYTDITLISDKIECKNPLGEYRRFIPQGTRLVGVTEDFVENVLERKDFFSYEIEVTLDNGTNITVEDYSDNEKIKELYGEKVANTPVMLRKK